MYSDEYSSDSDYSSDSITTSDDDSDRENDSADDENDIEPPKCPGGYDMGNGACLYTNKKLRKNKIKNKKDIVINILGKSRKSKSRKSKSKKSKVKKSKSRKSKSRKSKTKKVQKSRKSQIKKLNLKVIRNKLQKLSSTKNKYTGHKIVENNLPITNDNLPIIVLFHVTWCGYCKEFKPKYEQVAKQLHNIDLYEVDCDKNSALAKKYEVESYPTLLCITKDKTERYNGEREIEPVKRWIKTKLGIQDTDESKTTFAGVQDNKTVEDKTIQITDESVVINENSIIKRKENAPLQKRGVILFYANWCGHCTTTKPEYISAANENTDSTIEYYIVDGDNNVAALKKCFTIQGYPTIIFINISDDGTITKIEEFNEERTKSKIVNWVNNTNNNKIII